MEHMKPANKRSREDLPKQGYAAKPLMNVVPPWNAPRRLVNLILLINLEFLTNLVDL